jgi:hypothetical protein
MDKIIKELEAMKEHHERISGSLKMGLSSHFWMGKAEGIKEAIEVLRKHTNAEKRT